MLGLLGIAFIPVLGWLAVAGISALFVSGCSSEKKPEQGDAKKAKPDAKTQDMTEKPVHPSCNTSGETYSVADLTSESFYAIARIFPDTQNTLLSHAEMKDLVVSRRPGELRDFEHAHDTPRVGANSLCEVSDAWDDGMTPFSGDSRGGTDIDFDPDAAKQQRAMDVLRSANSGVWSSSTVRLLGRAFYDGAASGNGSVSDAFVDPTAFLPSNATEDTKKAAIASVTTYMNGVRARLKDDTTHKISMVQLNNGAGPDDIRSKLSDPTWGLGALVLFQVFSNPDANGDGKVGDWSNKEDAAGLADKKAFEAVMSPIFANTGAGSQTEFTDLLAAGVPFVTARQKYGEWLAAQKKTVDPKLTGKDKKAAEENLLAEVAAKKNAAIASIKETATLVGNVDVAKLNAAQYHMYEVLVAVAQAMAHNLGSPIDIVQPKQPREKTPCEKNPSGPGCQKPPPPKAKTCDEDPNQAKCKKAPPPPANTVWENPA